MIISEQGELVLQNTIFSPFFGRTNPKNKQKRWVPPVLFCCCFNSPLLNPTSKRANVEQEN